MLISLWFQARIYKEINIIDQIINDYQKSLDNGYNPNIILVQLDSEDYIVQQRGPVLPYKLRSEDLDISLKNPSV